jgi:hypothetical protein
MLLEGSLNLQPELLNFFRNGGMLEIFVLCFEFLNDFNLHLLIFFHNLNFILYGLIQLVAVALVDEVFVSINHALKLSFHLTHFLVSSFNILIEAL